MKTKNSILQNIKKDMPESTKVIFFIIFLLLVWYITGRYAPFAETLKQKILEGCEQPDNSFIIFIAELATGATFFIGSILVIGILTGVVYLLYCMVAFFIIEYRISKLPEDYFLKHEKLSPEDLCMMLNVFCVKKHTISKMPTFLRDNLEYIQNLTKPYTEEQIKILINHPAGNYFSYYRNYDKEDGWIWI